MLLNDDEMWQAVISCDKTYNGKFFYAVKTVGVYCLPSCRSRTPLRKNVSYHETETDAKKSGFRPCKRCRPDLQNHAPMSELAKQTKKLIDENYFQRKILIDKMKQLNVSTNHVASVFKQKYEISPLQYLNRIRMEYSKKMLSESVIPIIDIASEVGFDSLSAFYSFFKKQAGITPKKYRISSASKLLSQQ